MMVRLSILSSLTIVLLVGCQGGLVSQGESEWTPPPSVLPTGVVEIAVTNLLINGDFESGWTRDTLYWVGGAGPFTTEFNEVFTPEGWTSWWIEGVACPGADDYVTGRPEVNFSTVAVDPGRVYEGEQAAKLFTFWRCHDMGLVQEIQVVPGVRYSLTAYGHSWYSRCSTNAHALWPLDSDCVTRITWAQDYLSIGVDATGGLDPNASTVTWSESVEVYGEYADALWLRFEAEASVATVWIRATATHPLKHNDVYLDDVVLTRIHECFLPVILNGRD